MNGSTPHWELFLENHNIDGSRHVSNPRVLLQGQFGLDEDIGLPGSLWRLGRFGEARTPGWTNKTAADGNSLRRCAPERRDCRLRAPSSSGALTLSGMAAGAGPAGALGEVLLYPASAPILNQPTYDVVRVEGPPRNESEGTGRPKLTVFLAFAAVRDRRESLPSFPYAGQLYNGCVVSGFAAQLRPHWGMTSLNIRRGRKYRTRRVRRYQPGCRGNGPKNNAPLPPLESAA